MSVSTDIINRYLCDDLTAVEKYHIAQ